MTINRQPNLPAGERATLALRGLYEQFGFRKYQIGYFEEYGLYLQYKNFLTDEHIVSFTAPDGRLLALKPDVTLSIAKNIRLDNGPAKAYYIENVFREDRASGTIREISQMGLESIGFTSAYAQAEVLYLAAETLSAIGPASVLRVGHMGFILGLFDALGLSVADRTKVIEALAAKSPHGVEDAARAAGIGAVGLNVLSELCSLSGTADETFAKARGLCLNGRMSAALDELEATVRAVGSDFNLKPDFTLKGDMEYYDGLLMNGYVNGVPNAVLSGGRYDGLMKKLGRDLPAMGFALYLDDLKRLPRDNENDGADVILIADADAAPADLLTAVRSLTDSGRRVKVATAVPADANGAEVLRFDGKEVRSC